MRKLGEWYEPLHAAQVDERTEVRERGHRTRQHGARNDLLPRLLGHLGGAFLEQAAAREHEIAPVVAAGRHAKLEDAPDVLLRCLDAPHVPLRERTESAQAAHRDLVTALDDGGHLAFHGNTGLGRDGERLPGLRPLAKLVREPDFVPGRYHRGLDLVADGHAKLAVCVGELGALDPGLALTADIDEHALGRDLDDAPLHDLPDFEDGPGGFAREQGGEVFSVAHAHHPRRAFSGGQDGSGHPAACKVSSMAARSAGTSSGFVKYARTPPSRNCRIRDGIASALSTITGMSRVRESP